MKHNIGKLFDFCYGHRVHNQTLDPRLAVDTCLVCRHLHGHQGQIQVILSADELTDGMVTDFKHLGWFKRFIDDHLDHKMILDVNDPVLPDLFPDLFERGKPESKFRNIKKGLVFEEISDNVVVMVVAPDKYENASPALQEIYEGLVFVDFVPTSEMLSEWLFSIVDKKMGPLGIVVSTVIFKETPKTSAQYGTI